MDKITLNQLLQYFDTDANRIQIVPRDHYWDSADELSMDSELLEPFKDWLITYISYELAFSDGKPIVRVSIEPNKEK